MCGIAGFQAQTGNLSELSRRMAGTLAHRGPDDEGIWIDEQAGVALIHRRLAVLELSSFGHQPMLSASGRFVIVYNGETYNHLEMRLRLEHEHAAPIWHGHSDTETLLAAFEAWGVERTLKATIGMFAMAVWDRKECLLILARDRMGEKPLYYGWQKNAFLFASELKALKGHPAFLGEIDRGALALFLRHNYVPTPFSIYRNIFKLPAGSYLSIPLGNNRRACAIDPKLYWDIRAVAEHGTHNPFVGTEQEAVDHLDDLLRRSIKGQMLSDVPIGAFLSGGIDSSTIVALMQAQCMGPVKTFTMGFHEKEYNEAEYAKGVAQYLGTDHTEMYVTHEEALQVIPKLPTLYDEPFADSSQIPTHLMSQLARSCVTVCLSGDGGDELFGGYQRYFAAVDLWRKIGWIPRQLRSLGSVMLTKVPSLFLMPVKKRLEKSYRLANHDPDYLKKRIVSFLGYPTPEALYLDHVSHWKEPLQLVGLDTVPLTVLSDSTKWARLSTFEQQMLYLDQCTYLPDDILVKVDRASMGVSLETRVPMLDHRVVEFAWSLPHDMRIRNREGKWILRQVLDRYVPEALVKRSKMGFGIPIDHWLRGPLRDWAEALLDENRLRKEGYLNPEPIRRRWQEHLSKQADGQYLLWDVLMFQSWLEGI